MVASREPSVVPDRMVCSISRLRSVAASMAMMRSLDSRRGGWMMAKPRRGSVHGLGLTEKSEQGASGSKVGIGVFESEAIQGVHGPVFPQQSCPLRCAEGPSRSGCPGALDGRLHLLQQGLEFQVVITMQQLRWMKADKLIDRMFDGNTAKSESTGGQFRHGDVDDGVSRVLPGHDGGNFVGDGVVEQAVVDEVPGVMTRVTARSTTPFASLGSWTCSHTATRNPCSISRRR